MKPRHRVKLIEVRGDSFDVRIDGVMHRYLIQLPAPFRTTDAALLRTLDDKLSESMLSLATPTRSTLHPQAILAKLFQGVLKKDAGSTTYGFYPSLVSQRKAIANYIEKVGVEANIDAKTQGLIILKTDVDKIREGEV